MQLTIAEVKTNPSGKSLTVKAGGKDYFAKKDSGLQAGMVIEAETKVSDYNGKSNVWIEKWKAVAADTPTQTAGTNNGNTAAYMPFVSNTVAHAISAGLITDPAKIQEWANAAYIAAVKLGDDVPY